MFSLSKILVLLLILGLVWFGFQVAGELDKRRQARAAPRQRPNSGALDRPKQPAEDLRTCSVCGVYVAAEPTACGRDDCPYAKAGD